MGGVTYSVKQTVKDITIDMNSKIHELLLLLYFGCQGYVYLGRLTVNHLYYLKGY